MMETNQPATQSGGHIMQSRTTSTSHGLRSSSRGRRGRRYMQINSDGNASSDNYSDYQSMASNRRSSHSARNSDFNASDLNMSNATNNNNGSAAGMNDRMDENGRCRAHPGIELCRREHDEWRVLLQDCPLCSMAAPEQPPSNAQNHSGRKKGGESSLKTDSTTPLSEEEEKLWTMSDASSDGSGGNKKKQSIHNQQQQQQPPPPPRRKEKSKREDRKSRKKSSQDNNTMASLKELGKKLAAENQSESTNTTTTLRNSTNESKRRQHHPPPPPRRVTSNGEQSLRSLSTKELSELRRSRKNKEGIEEASDLISRMSLLSKSEPGLDGGSSTKRPSSRRGGSKREETEAILGAAAEARSLVLNRRSLLHGVDVEIPYNDNDGGRNHSRRFGSEGEIVRGRMRGNGGLEGDSILGAAEEIRSRARRSLSRSRERVKAASLFCGETPDYDGDESGAAGDDGNETVTTSTSKRSILNPHGLSVAPQAPAVERRSQSRGKERGYAPEIIDNDTKNNTAGIEHRPHSRNRRGTVDSISGDTNISSAQALINRRREMRERIAERQSNAAEKRHNRSDLDGSEKAAVNDLANAMLHEWSDVATPRDRRSSREKERGERGGRRGRSRSVVRDGLSKIRSASLTAFRKSTSSRSVVSGYDDANTVDTGRKSTASNILSKMKKHGRSLSRGRSVVSEFDVRSDCRSDSFALHSGGVFNSKDDDDNKSRSSIMRRFSMKSKDNGRSRRSSGKSNSFHRETSYDNDILGGEEGFARSTFTRRLSKTSPSHGMAKSLTRNNSVGDGLSEYGATKSEGYAKSESYAANHNNTPWYEEDDLDIHSRFKKKSAQGSTNPFD